MQQRDTMIAMELEFEFGRPQGNSHALQCRMLLDFKGQKVLL
jgi:hypothetical protein